MSKFNPLLKYLRHATILDVHWRGDIAIVKMNRLEMLNGIGHKLRTEISNALIGAAADNAIYAVILRAEGGANWPKNLEAVRLAAATSG